jgi:uncharacterized membrane protein YhhN
MTKRKGESPWGPILLLLVVIVIGLIIWLATQTTTVAIP